MLITLLITVLHTLFYIHCCFTYTVLHTLYYMHCFTYTVLHTVLYTLYSNNTMSMLIIVLLKKHIPSDMALF